MRISPCSIVVWIAAALCLSGLGCGTPHPRSAPAPPSAAPEPAPATPIDGLVARLVAARGLAPTRPIRVERLRRPAFVSRLLRGDTVRESGLTPQATLLLGFNFMPPPEERGHIVPVADVLADEVAGFYDLDDDVVVVPDEARLSRRERDEARAVLVHELQHAIQAQRFVRGPAAPSADAALAQRALYEGDATASMAATLGLEADEPVQRTLRRLGDYTRRFRVDVFHPESDPGQRGALPLARSELDFPYDEGVLFVGDLYRAGGFSLVDRAFDHPPATTEQVLHPHKYLAGELPHAFGEIPLPSGHHELVTGGLGELRTRSFFRQCYPPAFADAVAAGWSGDAFRISVGKDRRIVVSWVSAWDTEDDAVEVEGAVRTASGCFARNRLGEADDYEVTDRVAVRRAGNVVAVIRGAAPSDDARLDAMLGLARPVAAAPPLGPVTLVPRLPLPEPRPGTLRSGRYRNDWLGVGALLPRTFRASAGPDVEATVRTDDGQGIGFVFVSQALASGDALDRSFHRAARDVGRDLGQSLVREGVRKRRTFALGTAFEETFDAGNDVRVHVVFVPVCNATGSIGFVVAAPAERSARLTHELVSSFSFERGRNVPACAYLDPK